MEVTSRLKRNVIIISVFLFIILLLAIFTVVVDIPKLRDDLTWLDGDEKVVPQQYSDDEEIAAMEAESKANSEGESEENIPTDEVPITEKVELVVEEIPEKDNEVMNFDISGGSLMLSFDLLDHDAVVGEGIPLTGMALDSELALSESSVVPIENFNIIVDESKVETENKYKWGYELKLKDTKFIAKVEAQKAAAATE